jgi:hypothetical protein
MHAIKVLLAVTTTTPDDGRLAPGPTGGKYINITMHLEWPAAGEPGTRHPLRKVLTRAFVSLLVFATTVTVALMAGASGGNAVTEGICRLAGLFIR